MVPFFPNQISQRAVLVYVISLVVVSLVFSSYAMGLGYMALGIVWVFSFFFLVSQCSKGWQTISGKTFLEYIILISLVLRIVWVVASYFYYKDVTGIPFEFQARDSLAYHEDAVWMAGEPWSATWNYLFGNIIGIPDSGYFFFLLLSDSVYSSIQKLGLKKPIDTPARIGWLIQVPSFFSLGEANLQI